MTYRRPTCTTVESPSLARVARISSRAADLRHPPFMQPIPMTHRQAARPESFPPTGECLSAMAQLAAFLPRMVRQPTTIAIVDANLAGL